MKYLYFVVVMFLCYSCGRGTHYNGITTIDLNTSAIKDYKGNVYIDDTKKDVTVTVNDSSVKYLITKTYSYRDVKRISEFKGGRFVFIDDMILMERDSLNLIFIFHDGSKKSKERIWNYLVEPGGNQTNL